MLMLMLTAGAGGAHAQPNQPPERIWYKQAPHVNEGTSQYFFDITWIGDQNGDGCDEFLVCQEPLIRGYGDIDAYNTVELYLGNPEEISLEPSFTFETRDSLETMGMRVCYLGTLTAEGAHDFAILTAMYEPNQPLGDARQYSEVNIYRGGEGRFDTEADFRIRNVSPMQTDKPADINGDGFDDLICITGLGTIGVYYGGDDFDTEVDFTWDHPERGGFGGGGVFSGVDLNGDGYDDIITHSWNYDVPDDSMNVWDLFLGGNPPSSNPVKTWIEGQFDGYYITAMGLFTDCNADNFDDWAIGLLHPLGEGDYQTETWIFYGSDSLDFEPDLIPLPNQFSSSALCHGGDLNCDGIGDIVFQIVSSRYQLRILLGSHFLEEQDPIDWRGNPPNTQTQGAYADFNGDGAGDIAITGSVRALDGGQPCMAIFAGNRGWRVDVPREDSSGVPMSPEFSASAFPNPFNDQTKISFQIPVQGKLTLHLYDATGRDLRQIVFDNVLPGDQSYQIKGQGLPSGVYLLTAFLQVTNQTLETTLKITHTN